MKLTLDRVCLTTSDFCLKCINKIKAGTASDYDVKIGKILIKASRQNKSLRDITIERIVPTPSAIYIIVKAGDSAKFNQAGHIIQNQLSDAVGNNVNIVEKGKNVKRFIEEIMNPLSVASMNFVYIPPNGDKEMKIGFSENLRNKIRIPAPELSGILDALYGVKAHYQFN